MTSKLNPLAKAWDPSIKARKEDRTLFMIFPHANHVDKNQVFDFFQRMCGEGAVQDVYIYKKGGVDTTYGNIVFKNTFICAAVLKSGGCDDEAKYYIGHGHVFLKKYERR
ncbi:hypothetical protein FXO38_02777 [Capsicum annuum]|nr:hypothetical protein FXO38_02777 [Capsicum annuum]KAF3681366.1 hypothetical protein FXO37_02943 [Capsicum annuum]